MPPEIVVVGVATVYPGAGDHREFWEAILTSRRSFRRFPRQRLPLHEYGSENPRDRDSTYVKQAAVIDGFKFDWKTHRVPKAAFEATDPVHWLALTTALQAIKNAGVDLDAVGRDRIGVILGNSLTGEVSRANLLRLRWPFVRQAILDGAKEAGLSGSALAPLIQEIEQRFKSAFPPPNEDTLAGALSNVIAGRICNVLDFNGGGYVVDGACASSLLAVSAACEALETSRLDMAVAGGVDISLDPLEMVGFARTGALSTGPMRVYDRKATGFIPGEGCGMLVLMRGPDAARHGLKPWARIAGWGISSDGRGGITAPKAGGQALAMRRCYQHCGFGPDTLDFIEGHGTGTAVGDREELLGFLEVTGGGRRSDLRRTGLTSVKTLIGHTKAAAGAAGLIKAVLGVNQRVLPPMAGPDAPAAAFATPGANLYPLSQGRCLPPDTGLRAGVSGAGFGGINCHLAVTGEGIPKRPMTSRDAATLLASAQDAELFVASATDLPALRTEVATLLELSDGMAEGELVDLAVAVAQKDKASPLRAAVVAGSVDELRGRLSALAQVLETAEDDLPAAPPGAWLGRARPQLRVGLLFPGQGAQFVGMGSRLAQRSGWAATRKARWDRQFAELGPAGLSGYTDLPIERADSPAVTARWDAELRHTRIAQPAIVMTSLQWLQWLRQVGITPNAVAGHSLGEITALVAAHLLSEAEAMDIVRIRAEACAAGDSLGGMLALQCDLETAQGIVAKATGYAVVANDNAPDQVVVAGEPEALAAIDGLAQVQGVETLALNVSNAFHSRHMTAAGEALGRVAAIRGESRHTDLPFVSGVHGGPAPQDFDPFAYLAEQITGPVRFREAVGALAAFSDILVEVGPGAVLSGLARRSLGSELPICALEPGAGGADVRFCGAIAQLFVAGAALDWNAFYQDRYWRPFVPARERIFIENPCSQGENTSNPAWFEPSEPKKPDGATPSAAEPPLPDVPGAAGVEAIIRELLARETGYGLEMIAPNARPGRDLNLDSIKLAEVQAELRTRNIQLPTHLALADTSIRDIAAAAIWEQPPTMGPARDKTSVPTPAVTWPMPGELPVLGYQRSWREARLASPRTPLEPMVILHAPDQRGEAGRLAGRLLEAGARVRLDTGVRTPDGRTPDGRIPDGRTPDGRTPDGRTPDGRIPGHPPERLIVLPGDRADPEQVSTLFARLGAWIGAGIGSLVMVTRPGLAPVFGFAQSLSLELPELPILAVEAEADADLTPSALAATDPGVRLLGLRADGSVRGMALDPWEPSAASAIPLVPGDVVLVSGGAKGITAECTLALLRATRARALLLGASSEQAPGADVKHTLERFAAEGLEAVYLQCDVTDRDSVRATLERGKDRLGTHDIAGLVHGAGVNHPALAARLDAAVLEREYAVKVGGLDHLLAAVEPGKLKLCVAFGSVIGALGMGGNSGYALANEAMAQTLGDLRQAHPRMRIACPAYSVWAEVGMGARLRVLETLEQRNIAAIPLDQGIRWFLECCGQEAVPMPLVVAAPMQGLATWRQARGSDQPSDLPYMDPRVVHEPGRVLVSRPSLNPRRDDWLGDHVFRGTPLFATVQALTAIGAGARLLAGAGVVTRFLDLKITRPIAATRREDTVIEVDVRRGPTRDWTGRVGTPGSAWANPAFAVRCQLGGPQADAPESSPAGGPQSGWREVPSHVGPRLYDAILFQGRRFQRIEALLALNLDDAIHRRGRFRVRRACSKPHAPVPDAFFLDALLQTVQVLVPRDLCLPVGIDETVFYPAAWEAGATRVEAEIVERTDTGYVARVRAWNDADDAPVARYEGYRVSIVEHLAGRPDAHALLAPLAADRAALDHWVAGQPELADLSVVLGHLEDSDQATRRIAATAQIAGQLGLSGPVLNWSAEGAPRRTDRPEQGVSIAHDAAWLLTLCGPGRVGCDLQRIGQTSRPWNELLPASRTALWQELSTALNDRDRAGALVWAIHEALIKAGTADAGVTFVGIRDTAPRFRLDAGGTIAAGVLELLLAGPTAIALAQPGAGPGVQPVTHYSRAIEMTFKEALPPLKSPTASVFFAWMGALREEAMSPIRPLLVRAFSEGGMGMVTNGTRIRVPGPVPFSANLRAWVWLERVLTSQPSTFELGFQWAETGPDGTPQRIVAQGVQRLTWVAVVPDGHVTVEPFPTFFADFIAARLPPSGVGPYTPPLGPLAESGPDEAIIPHPDPGTNAGRVAARLTLETDETHSNFVGNIYFSHAATLLERTCQKALRAQGDCPGGFFATGLRLDHLGEAMPGDILEAQAHLSKIRARDCRFELTLLNQSQGGLKIASGNARYSLFTTTSPEPLPLPGWLVPTSTEEAQ